MELPEGLHFRFEHCRNYQAGVLTGSEDVIPVDPRGGTTIAHLENDENEVLEKGYAHCSKNEQYVKKIGRDIAAGRALKSYYAKVNA